MADAEASGLVGPVMILTTNGGPHQADKWANVAAEFISDLVQIDEKAHTPAAATGRKAKKSFAVSMTSSLEQIFVSVMAEEKAKCDANIIVSRTDPFDVDVHLDDAVDAVVAASQGTPFTSHFAKPATKSVVRNLLKQSFIDAAFNERSWAFDAKGL